MRIPLTVSACLRARGTERGTGRGSTGRRGNRLDAGPRPALMNVAGLTRPVGWAAGGRAADRATDRGGDAAQDAGGPDRRGGPGRRGGPRRCGSAGRRSGTGRRSRARRRSGTGRRSGTRRRSGTGRRVPHRMRRVRSRAPGAGRVARQDGDAGSGSGRGRARPDPRGSDPRPRLSRGLLGRRADGRRGAAAGLDLTLGRHARRVPGVRQQHADGHRSDRRDQSGAALAAYPRAQRYPPPHGTAPSHETAQYQPTRGPRAWFTVRYLP